MMDSSFSAEETNSFAGQMPKCHSWANKYFKGQHCFVELKEPEVDNLLIPPFPPCFYVRQVNATVNLLLLWV